MIAMGMQTEVLAYTAWKHMCQYGMPATGIFIVVFILVFQFYLCMRSCFASTILRQLVLPVTGKNGCPQPLPPCCSSCSWPMERPTRTPVVGQWLVRLGLAGRQLETSKRLFAHLVFVFI